MLRSIRSAPTRGHLGGGRAHDVRVLAEQLDRHRAAHALLGVDRRSSSSSVLLVAVVDGEARDHLRDGQPGAVALAPAGARTSCRSRPAARARRDWGSRGPPAAMGRAANAQGEVRASRTPAPSARAGPRRCARRRGRPRARRTCARPRRAPAASTHASPARGRCRAAMVTRTPRPITRQAILGVPGECSCAASIADARMRGHDHARRARRCTPARQDPSRLRRRGPGGRAPWSPRRSTTRSRPGPARTSRDVSSASPPSRYSRSRTTRQLTPAIRRVPCRTVTTSSERLPSSTPR